jgi:CheY-like chemotaxis protein
MTDDVPAISHGTERIVVVDDDLFVRRATSRALRSHGYDVIEAGDGASALRVLEHHGRSIALLVTDVVMPMIDGRELAETARRRRPTLKVLYMSGYTDDAVLRHGVDDRIIEKPFRSHVLAARVRQMLDVDG